jgi:protein-S-isoprenylcysteine O-methyltransferase Ste14
MEGTDMNAARICSDLWVILAAIWLMSSVWSKQTQERAAISSRLAYGIPVFIAFYLLFNEHVPVRWMNLDIIPRNPFLGGLGIATTAIGVALAVWARFSIGGNWSSAVTVKIGHQLIRNGPYAWVRHPIYSGLLLATLGAAVATGELRGLLAFVLLWVAFRTKSRLEEQMMLRTFGTEYEQYIQSTGALVPRASKIS